MAEPNEPEAHRADLRAEIRDYRQEWMANVKAVREDIASLAEMFDNGFAMFDRGFAEMRERFDQAAAAQRHILELVTILAEKRRRK